MTIKAITLWLTFLLLSHLSWFATADVEEYLTPQIDGVRLDWCLSYGVDCGEEVAYKWCIENNYSKPLYWEIDKDIGVNEPTSTLNSRESCYKDACDGFKTIVCYRSAY